MTREEALRVLGLKSDATPSEVQVAYRELAQMLHPDKFGDNKRLRERAEQQMRTINEARDVLMKGSRASSGAARPGRGSKTSRRRDMTPSIATMLVVWGVVDVVSMGTQVSALESRSRDLLQARDAARKIAEEARKL